LGLFGGAAYFGSLDTDPMKPIWGIDPFIFYGACTAACMVGVGYIVGPTLGSSLWRIIYRRSAKLMDARDREFYQRIAKNRVDASLQSPTSPVPDYYGERIGSLRQYRRVSDSDVFYCNCHLIVIFSGSETRENTNERFCYPKNKCRWCLA
ncbi:mitochondrial import protein Pam17-domain-containing protein, partial [Desarmillaria tabescens]